MEQIITGFDTDLGVPLLTNYTVSGNTKNNTGGGEWIEDSRLETNHTGSCQRLSDIARSKEVVYTHLFPKGKRIKNVCVLLNIELDNQNFLSYLQNLLLRKWKPG
jgi:hypothetical protein